MKPVREILYLVCHRTVKIVLHKYEECVYIIKHSKPDSPNEPTPEQLGSVGLGVCAPSVLKISDSASFFGL